MGIIDSLSVGFRLLGRRFELLLIPVGLDLWLWFAPRLSIAPLFERLSAIYTQAANLDSMPPDVAEMSGQVAEMLMALGGQSNIWGMLVNGSMLHCAEPDRGGRSVDG